MKFKFILYVVAIAIACAILLFGFNLVKKKSIAANFFEALHQISGKPGDNEEERNATIAIDFSFYMEKFDVKVPLYSLTKAPNTGNVKLISTSDNLFKSIFKDGTYSISINEVDKSFYLVNIQQESEAYNREIRFKLNIDFFNNLKVESSGIVLSPTVKLERNP